MKFFNAILILLQDLTGLLFPELCCACSTLLHHGEGDICTSCIHNLPYTDHHIYKDNKVARKLWGRIPFHQAMALLHFRKGNSVQNLIHHLKYKGKKGLGVKLGTILAGQLISNPHYQGIDLIIPIPLHKKKEQERGYNQSMCIADGLSAALNIPVAKGCLIRKVATSSQTRKSRYKRYENMKEVFGISDPAILAGKHVLLVDDVITTGATIEACAMELYRHGIGKLSIATIAFAD
ncbi:ComF family protein [Pedobacter frigoris]|uniref:ComF family protein n=1 Tax=Pedobacter frigoris TaxID=2571272 RepID=UPI001CED100F|nr:phosphoribosyltransferase family protein [Pedobacter frigoris]